MINWKWLIPAVVIGYNVGFDVRGRLDRAAIASYEEAIHIVQPILSAIDRASESGGDVVIRVRKNGTHKTWNPNTIV